MFDIDKYRQDWQAEVQAIDTAMASIDDVAAKVEMRSDGWTAQSVLGHIASSTRGLLILAERSRQGSLEFPPGFSVDSLNDDARARDDTREVAATRAFWDKSRQVMDEYLSQLTQEGLQLPVSIPWIPRARTQSDLLGFILEHVRGHRAELQDGAKTIVNRDS